MKPIQQQFKQVLVSAAYTAGVLLTGLTYAAEPGVTQHEIVICQVGPLTGVLAGPNRENVEGALAYLKFINKQGGIHGRKIILKQFDDEQNAQKALDITKMLIADRSVFAFAMHRPVQRWRRSCPKRPRRVPGDRAAGRPDLVYGPSIRIFNVRALPRRSHKIIEQRIRPVPRGSVFLR